jgi:solute:Na+ symporter, SSS family
MNSQQIALWVPIAAYVVFIAAAFVSVVVNREAVTAEGYSVGDRKFTVTALFLTIAATMIGPSASIGAVEKASSIGFYFVVLFCFLTIQLWVFGAVFVEKLHELGRNSRTIGDVIGKGYGTSAQVITGIATLGQSLAFSGVLCLGGAKVLQAIFGIPIEYGTVSIAVFTAFYTMVGGLPAVVKTDKVQFLGFLILLLLGFIALWHMPQGAFSRADWFASAKSPLSVGEILALTVAFALGEAFIPIYAVRGIVGIDGKTAKRGFIAAAIFGIFWFLILGMFGASYAANFSGVPATGIVLLDYVLYPFSDPLIRSFVMGCFAVALMGVVMSTFDSILNAGAVSVTRDLIAPFVRLSDEDEFSIAKVVVLTIAVFGVGFTLLSDDIVQILFWGYTFWAPAIVAPLGYLIYRRGNVHSRLSGLIAMICGGAGWLLGETYLSKYIPSILTGLIISALALAASEIWAKIRANSPSGSQAI